MVVCRLRRFILPIKEATSETPFSSTQSTPFVSGLGFGFTSFRFLDVGGGGGVGR
jgi:hypothetical protein